MSATRQDTGVYTCVARNKAGEDTFTVTLTVLGKLPHAIIQIASFARVVIDMSCIDQEVCFSKFNACANL